MKIISGVIAFLFLFLTSGWAKESDLSKRILPTLPLKEAIDIAEAYLKDQKISKEGRFLARVDYHDSDSWTQPNKDAKTSGPYWQVTYEPDRHAAGGQIFILVYMNRSIRELGGL